MRLYTVHGIRNGRNIIGLYALLTNKQQNTYERMLRHVEFLTGNASPTAINIDLWECFFHLSQNIYKRVQENYLSDLYQNDIAFRTNVRMICAIAFVPL